MSSAGSALCPMPSQPTNPDARRRGGAAPGDPLAPFGPRKARWSHFIAIAVTGLAILGGLIAIPLVRAVFPAVLDSVAPIMIRAVVRVPASRPSDPPQKTTACTHLHGQAADRSHRHVCS